MTGPIRLRLSAGSGPTFGVDDLACAAAGFLGCWEEEGVLVDWTPARGGLAAMRLALDGAVDVAYGGLGPMLRLRAEGAPVRVVVSMARALAQNLVVRPSVARAADIPGKVWAVDGIGALSHHMARVIVDALGLHEGAVDWRAVGPPPERIAALLAGEADLALLRVEEALALTADPANDLRLLLGFDDLKRLAPLQPHGVLATTEAFEAAAPEALARLTRGMIAASRRLHDDFDAFRATVEAHVTVRLDPAAVANVWRQERESGGFARDGEMTDAHWTRQIAAFARLHHDLPPVDPDAILARGFVRDALERMGAADPR